MSKPQQSIAGDDTRNRILEVSARTFAQRGIENVSLREITRLACVNVAAINYHFGGKEGLAEAIFDDLAPRVNATRLAELNSILQRATARSCAPTLADIVRSFMRPYLSEHPSDGGGLLAQLVFRHRLSPTPATHDIISRHFDPMAHRYIAAFALACPGASADELSWRYFFMGGAVLLAASERTKGRRMASLTSGRVDGKNAAEAIEALTRFLVGAIAYDDHTKGWIGAL
jgi:AcrR family transcriptional regulator